MTDPAPPRRGWRSALGAALARVGILRLKILGVMAGSVVTLLALLLVTVRGSFEEAARARMDDAVARMRGIVRATLEREQHLLDGEAPALAREVRLRDDLVTRLTEPGQPLATFLDLLRQQYAVRPFAADRLAVYDADGKCVARIRRDGGGFSEEPAPAGRAPDEAWLERLVERLVVAADATPASGASQRPLELLVIGTHVYVPSNAVPVVDPARGPDEPAGFLVAARELHRTGLAAEIERALGDPACFVAEREVVATSLDGRADTDALRTALGAASHAAVQAGGATDRDLGGSPRRVVPTAFPTIGGTGLIHGCVAFDLARELGPAAEAEARIYRVAGAVLVGVVAVALLLATGIDRPIRRLVHATDRIASGDLEVSVPVTSHDEIGTLARHFDHMAEGLRERERVRGLLDKVVSSEVASELVRLQKDGRLVLGGEARTVTVLFCDMRGFTKTTEHMTPEQVIAMLNEYLTRLCAPIEAEGGVIDKFVGDAIMALFGAPLMQADQAARAVAAARGMMAALSDLNAARALRGDPPLACGIGINTGRAVAGLTGSPGRLSYTVLGADVNLASRLCSAATPGQILISEGTFESAGAMMVNPRDPITVKGFSKPIQTYEVPVGGSGRPA